MSDESYGKKLIKEFLNDVEEKLPTWLRNNEDELHDVLDELKEHIEDKIDAILASGEVYLNAVRIAISEMGRPSKIAEEFKRRGTPKYYITKELWPTYLQTFKILCVIVIVINLIVHTIEGIILGLIGGDWSQSIVKGFSYSFIGSLCIFVGTTLLFTWLSGEGYFLDDIKDLFKSKEELKNKPKYTEIEQTTESINKEIKKVNPKGISKPHDLIIGGSFKLIFGIIAVWQPISQLNVLINSQFLLLLMAIGVFWIVLGTMELSQGIFAIWSYKANKILLPSRSIISLISIPILVLFLSNPQIFPLFWWNSTLGFYVIQIPVDFYWIYYLVLSIIILAVIVSSIVDIVKAIRLKEEDFYR